MALSPFQRGGAGPTGFGGMVSLRTISERREIADVREVTLPTAELFVVFLRGVCWLASKSNVGRFWTAVASDCGSAMGSKGSAGAEGKLGNVAGEITKEN